MHKLRLASAVLGVSAAATGSSLYLMPSSQETGAQQSASFDSGLDQQSLPGQVTPVESSDSNVGTEAHQTYFQAQASLSDSYPALPSGDFGSSSAPAMPGAISPPTLPPATATALPSAYPGSLSSQDTAGSTTPRPVVHSQTTPSYASPSTAAPTLPSPSYAATSRNAQPTVGGANSTGNPSGYGLPGTTSAPTYPSAAVLPEMSTRAAPASPSSAPSVTSNASAGRAGPSVPGQMIGYQQPARNMGDGNALRSIDGRPPANAGVYPPSQIATGLPYVTPAPKGTYATRPYNHALFQTAEFQRTAQQPGGYAVSSQRGPGQLASSQAQTQVVVPQPTSPPYVQPPGSSVPGNLVAATNSPQAVVPYNQPAYAAGGYTQSEVGMRPVVSFGQEKNPVVMGQGIVGQPTAYVPGQPIRNFFRYLFP